MKVISSNSMSRLYKSQSVCVSAYKVYCPSLHLAKWLDLKSLTNSAQVICIQETYRFHHQLTWMFFCSVAYYAFESFS